MKKYLIAIALLLIAVAARAEYPFGANNIPDPYGAGGAIGGRIFKNPGALAPDSGRANLYAPTRPPSNSLGILNGDPYDPDSLSNPYGAGSPFKPDGLMNPLGPYGSPYSDKPWTNPYATDAPKIYDSRGNYRGRLSVNPYAPDSTANPYGRYGSPYSPDSINNPFGPGDPYNPEPLCVVPSE